MEKKYLPLGSICTLKGKNKKVMIVGYYSVEYKGNLKIKDYLGCAYPEGMLLPEQVCTFNHNDIENIDFIGYKSNELNSFMKNFNELTGNNSSLEQEAAEFHKNSDMILTSSKAYSKLLFDENGIVMIAEPVVEEKKENKKTDSYQFDENGYVISVNKDDTSSNPFYKIYNEEEKVDESIKSDTWDIFNKVESTESNEISKDNTDKKSTLLNRIEFDENGIVIAVRPEEDVKSDDALNKSDNVESQQKTQYTFDENGIVTSVN